MLRVLRKCFPDAQENIEAYCLKNRRPLIEWKKKPFLATVIEGEELSTGKKIGRFVTKMKSVRIVFYGNLIKSQIMYHSFLIFSQMTIEVSKPNEIVSTFFGIAVLPILMALLLSISCSPLEMFKCTGILAKKRNYKIRTLWIFFLYEICELVLFGGSVAVFKCPIYQILPLFVTSLLKLFIMKRQIKRIEFAKSILIAVLMAILLAEFIIFRYSASPSKKMVTRHLEFTSIIVILTICGIEVLKLIKAVIVSIVGLLRYPVSLRGQQIIDKVKEHRKNGN